MKGYCARKHRTKVSAVCEAIGYSRQAYYRGQALHRAEEEFEQLVLLMVREIRLSHMRMGTRKLVVLLAGKGIGCGRDVLFRLLGREGLLIRRRRNGIRTTDSRHNFRRYGDLSKELVLVRPHQLWVADITYVRVGEKFWYLSLITDAYSRYVVGYDISESLAHEGAMRCLKRALSGLDAEVLAGLMHHSDRGVQYCCHVYVAMLKKHKIAISMTETGSPYDNAKAERVNGILKQEYGLGANFEDAAELKRAVKVAIKRYNEERPHCALAMKTPKEVHEAVRQNPFGASGSVRAIKDNLE